MDKHSAYDGLDAVKELVRAVQFAEHGTRRLNPDEYAVNDFRQQKVWECAHDLAKLLNLDDNDD